ncbi:hypothetical protein G9C85_06935 [Halorubellus sp. JP-L1]|uniref:DUF7577 domain-containing protein n=1 Tax=Halorubellus sp. JP-L1 TaxID=2715753 RepID=UPI00140E88FF|nr:hypothetical protein [Halorubellus sp. JP-L1]NHN41372.1 hypothetical protein [Halorubellus sp. JP-L1]
MTPLSNPVTLAVVCAFVLVQVPLVAYLAKHVALDGDADRPDPTDGYVTYGTADARPATNELAIDAGDVDGAGGGRSCPHCGGVIDDGYEYCGACAGRIRDAASPHGGPRRGHGGSR